MFKLKHRNVTNSDELYMQFKKQLIVYLNSVYRTLLTKVSTVFYINGKSLIFLKDGTY